MTHRDCHVTLLLLTWLIAANTDNFVVLAGVPSTLPRSTTSPPPTLYIAANLHNNAHTISTFVKEILRLQKEGFPGIHVTVYESGSTDATPNLLHQARRQFDDANITHAITTHGALVRGRRSRIDFLADARNELLKPLRAMAVQGRVFDNVVFLNDVLFTADDVVKLLSVGSDVSCGTDFIPIGDANEIYSPTVNETYPIFYDAWVARTLDGLPLRAMPPYVPPASIVPTLMTVASLGLSFPDYTRLANTLEVDVQPQPEIVQLQCCWNGVVVVQAAPFYRGLSFRSNMPGECAGSECSHFCADMWALNYTRFTMHHGVRVAYDNDTWARAKELDVPYEATPVPFSFNDTARPPAVLCCGEHRVIKQPVYHRQSGESTDAFVYRVWMAITETVPSVDVVDYMVTLVGNDKVLHIESLREFVSDDEPRAPCVMQPLKSLVLGVCLVHNERAIPRLLVQAGAADAHDALSPWTTTWKSLHPDHDYVFVDVDADAASTSWNGVPSATVAVFQAVRAAGHHDVATDIVRYALLYAHGGIVADVNVAAGESLSCLIKSDDDLVAVYATGSETLHHQPIALAAIKHHPTVLHQLSLTLERAVAVLSSGYLDHELGGAFALPQARRVHVAAQKVNVPVLTRGQGARIKHHVDTTARA